MTLFPASFSWGKIIKLVDVFQRRARYVPTLVTMNPGEPPQQHYGHFDIRGLADVSDENPSHHVDAPPSKDGKGWPMGELPTEIFQRMAEELSWDDLLNMRRVNHEFEMKVSGFIFKAVVVPFRRQIYSAKISDEIVHTKDLKGKGKATHDPVDDQHLHMVKHGYYSNVKDKDIYNGMEVFNAWGPHIRKFAMSFEVNEGKTLQLTRYLILKARKTLSYLILFIIRWCRLLSLGTHSSLTPIQMFFVILPTKAGSKRITLFGGHSFGLALIMLVTRLARTWRRKQMNIS